MKIDLSYMGKGGFLLILIVCLGCSALKKVKTEYTPPDKIKAIDRDSPFLQAHMQNGDLYIFENWEFISNDSLLTGDGKYYNANRNLLEEGSFEVFVSDVQLFESNTTELSSAGRSLLILTGISAAVTGFCIINPKACFGSCPTFYTSTKNGEMLQAEGFSNSVLPALEETDIDALYFAESNDSSNEFKVRVTNEALETHNIKYADLLVLPNSNGRVFASKEGGFYSTKNIINPREVRSGKVKVGSLLQDFDKKYYFSKSDSSYLATKEYLHLEFEGNDLNSKELGLVIGARQSLMSTYLFYQALSYMGNSAGYMLAQVERNAKDHIDTFRNMGKLLGPIEVQVLVKNKKWRTIGSFNETGPLATDVQIIPLEPVSNNNLKYRLKFTKGHWRIDYLALAEIDKKIKPHSVSPKVFTIDGEFDSNKTKSLNNRKQYLTTLPGDEYNLVYTLPDSLYKAEFFLESRGYYLEWMREEWIEEENTRKALKMFLKPEEMLRELAPAYKEVEPKMEKIFWNSRYVKD